MKLTAILAAVGLGLTQITIAQDKAVQPGLSVGANVADAELRTVSNEPVKLTDLYAKGPLVVVFYRGGWCPFCNTALTGWQDHLADLKAAGGTLVAITPEKPGNAAKTIQKDKLDYKVLSDTRLEAAKAFKVIFTLDDATQKKYKGYGVDLQKWNASETWDLPAPGTFVIDTTGTVRYASADWDYTKRAKPEEAIAVVKTLGAAPASAIPALDWSKVSAASDGTQVIAWKTIARYCDAWYKGEKPAIELSYRGDGKATDAAGHTIKVAPEHWKGIVAAARNAPGDKHVEAVASLSAVYSSGRTDIPQDKFGLLPRYTYRIEAKDDNTLRFVVTGKLDGGI